MNKAQNSIYGIDAAVNEIDREVFISEIFKSKRLIEIDIENYPDLRLRLSLLEIADRARAKGTVSYRSIYPTSQRRFYFGVVASHEVGAWSFTSDVCDFVAVCVGTFIQIYNFFGCLLSHPQSFNNIANAEREDSKRLEGAATMVNGKWTFADVRPLDRFRDEYAKRLAVAAVDTIITHEVQHLINGHHSVLSNSAKGPNDAGCKMALESDADLKTAATAMHEARYLRSSYLPPEDFTSLEAKESVDLNNFFYGTPGRGFATVCYALYGAFFITKCQTSAKPAFHPEPMIRLQLALHACRKVVVADEGFELRPAVINKQFRDNIELLHSALVNLIGNENALSLAMQPWCEESRSGEVAEILRSVANLKPAIQIEARRRRCIARQSKDGADAMKLLPKHSEGDKL